MNTKQIVITVLVVSGVLGGLIVLNEFTQSSRASSASQGNNGVASSDWADVVPADSVEVVHFHGAQQCYSCIMVGKYAKETIEQKFAKEVASGRIVFREVNGELPENKEIVQKYQARGSSLFINARRGETDDISEDTVVWRLVGNQSDYSQYFEEKLTALLGKK